MRYNYNYLYKSFEQKVELQTNGDDCGVFICKVKPLYCLLHDSVILPNNYSTLDMVVGCLSGRS